MANSKTSDFITRSRQIVRDYKEWVKQSQALIQEYQSLYNTLLYDTEFEGDNLSIIPNPSYTQSLINVIGNVETILTTYDNGIDTNFDRVA